MIAPIQAQWKIRQVDGVPVPTPYVTTSGFAVDPMGCIPLMYRGPNVRSAKNSWSLPSGLHECGYTLSQQLAIELKEEIGLDADEGRAEFIGTYENIAAVDSWHWVISVLAIPVKTLDTLENKEPDKHPEIRKVRYTELSTLIHTLTWAPGLGKFLHENQGKIRQAILNVL